MRIGAGVAKLSQLLIDVNKDWGGHSITNLAAPPNVHIGQFTGEAVGDQPITGLGFKPKVLIFIAYEPPSATETWSTGFDNGIIAQCNYKGGQQEAVSQESNRSIIAMRDFENYIRGYVSSLGADGFTITWDRLGTGTANVTYLAIG